MEHLRAEHTESAEPAGPQLDAVALDTSGYHCVDLAALGLEVAGQEGMRSAGARAISLSPSPAG